MNQAISPALLREGTEAPERLGRFQVVRELGRGSQGVVYLARDPQLDRLVAVKTVHRGRHCDPARLLREARLVARLAHPSIVPLLDAGGDDAEPYLVWEYVEGTTLAARLRSGAPLGLAEAVIWMSQMLAGVAHAHANGILHLDLTPANVLIDAAGRPRIADFGIAAWRSEMTAPSGAPAGTVRYMAPERFQATEVGPPADVFALGLLFFEMLTGKPAVHAESDIAAIYAVTHEPLRLPSAVDPRIDPRIDAIFAKAVRKEPGERYPDAAAMKLELDRVRVDRSGKVDDAASRDVDVTVQFLFRRLRSRGDFPALSRNVVAINQIATSRDDTSVRRVANYVLKDVALTTRLLQLANSGLYGSGGKPVTDISRAVVLLGMDQVRVAATSLALVGRMLEGPHADVLRDGAVRSFGRAILARDLARAAGFANRERFFIGAMLRSLGRDLTIHYFPTEYAEIAERLAVPGTDEDEAWRGALGVPAWQIGIEVGRTWKLPAEVLAGMERLPAGELPRPADETDWVRQCAGYADELVAAGDLPDVDLRAGATRAVAERYAAAFDPGSIDQAALLEGAVGLGAKYCAVIGVAAPNCRPLALLAGLASELRASATGGEDAEAGPQDQHDAEFGLPHGHDAEDANPEPGAEAAPPVVRKVVSGGEGVDANAEPKRSAGGVMHRLLRVLLGARH